MNDFARLIAAGASRRSLLPALVCVEPVPHLPTGAPQSGKTGQKGDLLLGRRICLSEVHYSGYGLAPRQFGSGIEEGLFKLEIEVLRDPFELSTILLYRR
jgi:hypothetical protein